MMYPTSLLALFAFSFPIVLADVYLHSPRGSNDRLDEQNRERANGNRLFDSQNNNRGGYNVGKMIYYQGEKIPLDWTNQHGASKYQMENSEFIIQYMCSPILRDGTTTRTIPIKATECYNYDCDTDVRFGRHESLDNYEMCTKTSRNKGLLTLNQNLQGDAAKYTRQNNDGTRHAYECPEERDYYPYWRPSPWIDALIITADEARCASYQAESQNVKERHECRMPDAFFDADGELPNNFVYAITQDECEAQTLDDGADTPATHTAEWKTIPAHGVAAPECMLVAQTRANHLGNPGGRTNYAAEWTVPSTIPAGSQCAVRMRYNITTNDYSAWATGASLEVGLGAEANSQKNKPNPGKDPAEFAIWENYGLTRADVEESFNRNNADEDGSRGFVMKNNPKIDAFGEYLDDAPFNVANDNVIKMQLAVNTAQFGRTFQDRSHYFIVEERPAEIPADAVIKLQTVRGKRGNIVQTYPATEYFMHPEVSWARVGEYVHWQWTGSNTNPNNNDGQGKQGTDRSNMVATRSAEYDTSDYSNFLWDMAFENGEPDNGMAMRAYPKFVKNPDGYEIPEPLVGQIDTAAFGGMDEDILVKLATTRQNYMDTGNMEELDDAATSFFLEPQEMKVQGCTNYLCTRNNNFSNRAQKGKFCVSEGDVGEVMVSSAGGTWWDSEQGSSVTLWPDAIAGMEKIHMIVHHREPNTATLSVMDVHLVGTMTVQVGFTPQALKTAQLVWQPECQKNPGATTCAEAWSELDFSEQTVNEKTVASADVTNTGTFMVVFKPNPGPIIALTVSIGAFVCALCWVLANKCCADKLPSCPCCKGGESGVEMGSVQATGSTAPPPFTGEKGEGVTEM